MNLGAVIGLIVLAVVTFGIGEGTNAIAAVCATIFFPTVIILYFAPTIHAYRSKHPSIVGISTLNIFLGWTALGWIGALIWAYSPARPTDAATAADPTTSGSADTRTCPFCAETIRTAAIKCRHCGEDVSEARLAPRGIA